MIRLLSGDARDVLPTLPAESVQCVVTSPPYYALRSYLDAAHPDKHREIGSEATPDEYLATMVGVFREIRRVMRNDAVAFINMGDSYSDKRLLLMPARLALALQADGWWVRSAIVWAKPNPMPESVSDRPTSAYEMVYLLTRSSRYYYDADAVREELTGNTRFNLSGPTPAELAGIHGVNRRGSMSLPVTSRNMRNVWTIATSPFSAAHFATFPPELAERCIKAGTSERGCCAACGKPWVRVTSKAFVSDGKSAARGPVRDPGDNRVEFGAGHGSWDVTTTGWRLDCGHRDAETVPCTVLDPFAGAGTTLLVADRLQRDAIGIELNTAYTEMAMERCRADAPLFTAFPPAEPPEDERMGDLFAGDEYEHRPTVVSERTDAFRNSGRYVNQGPQPSNGVTDMAAD